MNPTLLVLAAGMGSRYGGLKQADPMGPHGETVLDYSVFDAIRAGFGRVVFVIRKAFAAEFEQRVASRFSDRIPIEFTYQELDTLPSGFCVPEGREKPWGTAHAILSARDVIRENFCVINADDFYGRDAYQRMAAFQSKAHDESRAAQYSMVGYHLDQTLSEHGSVARGLCQVDAAGHLIGVTELTKIFKTPSGAENRSENGEIVRLDGSERISMNFWGFTPSLFGQIEDQFLDFLRAHGNELKSELYIPTVVDRLIRGGKAEVTVLKTDSAWFGVTYREDKSLVQESIRKLIEAGEYPEIL